MAAELVIGSLLSASFDFLLEKIASPYVEELLFKGNQSSVSERLFKLKSTFNCLAAVRFEVENKRIKNPAVEKWLDDLLDAVDDAEDFFGDVEYDALKPKKAAESRKARRKASKLLSCFFSKPSNSIDRKRNTDMEDILQRLELLANQIGILNLENNVIEVKPSEMLFVKTSLLDEPEVYGRDNDKDALMKSLISDDVGGDQKIYDVIPIVGMGGIGKTTLAQTLFNDEEMMKMFELKVWVYVSDKFDAMAVTETILQQVASGDDVRNGMDLNSLQVNLAKKLMGKKFLIVLDDAWADDYVQWKEVMKPFKDGAKGSKIVVTTRNKTVADSIGTVDPHYLKELSKDECWELFAKHASRGNLDMFIENPKLESIGREVVKKCNGLPLAAKVLGGLLRSTLDAEKWEQIAKSNIWEMTDKRSKVLPAALEVSYRYLPPHLKKCFAYCSIFPKGYEFQRQELILIWMAENLVMHSEGSKRMEEIVDEYFDELISMSFFQPRTNYNNEPYFVMHDLIVDLARAVSGKYCYLLEHIEDIDKFEKKTRHLGCATEVLCYGDKISTYDFKATRLRTLLSISSGFGDSLVPKEVVHDLLPKLKCLKVLSFRGRGITDLADSIGDLKYLRYLDLSGTDIVMLPESVTVLYNLQTLKLENCRLLKTLPKDMHQLINLRHLIFSNAGLVEMPSQISKLTKLQMLTTFVVGKDSGAKIEELAKLSSLRGELSIQKLENVANITKASDQVNVLDKKLLEILSLEWTAYVDVDVDPKHGESVLEMLSPNTTLKQIEILGYPGTKFPNWIGDDSFNNIVDIKLSGSRHCSNLPPLGQLPSLKILHISSFDSVTTVGAEFYGNSSAKKKPFSSLEILIFENMSAWKQWHSMQTEDDAATYRKLKTLEIKRCYELIGDLPRFLPSLTRIIINADKQCSLNIPRLPCVTEMRIRKLENVESLYEAIKAMNPSSSTGSLLTTPTPLQSLTLSYCGSSFRSFHMDLFPTLRTLDIYDCDYFEALSMSDGQCRELTFLSIYRCLSFVSFPNGGLIAPKLREFRISRCRSFVSFPNGGLIAPKLREFRISLCPKLKWLPEKMTSLSSLKSLTIESCSLIKTIPEGGLPISLSTLGINYHQLLRMKWNRQTLPHLRVVTVEGDEEDLESFPEERLLPATITSLSIHRFSKLRGLDKNGLSQLTSLQQLHIRWCPELQTLSEEGFPTSLRYLCIINCPLLKKIYDPKESENKEYSSKISHIPHVLFR
ncbi:putative disease resistance protein At3g14460 isoform X1 [Humulus lupulus]|uniref:putative disease resistance protein At3g14460 isoform X1 n=1 Tax=Humulus lupulus TaxID=3486 RepID=UPI002B40197F|nr:putative disease resistance protein At3g14460 isoform X1 [Humulus lupulus]XP_062113510.1 putative disease resistance protein At3g14460 isoform X1 [Humulus lupulus]XP_062113511.1 putative disease resistance protein At3g14460 isoform X1 [Humulus lupulus]XP_062113512.1 putative disease resistance protein At3g14460 isoform X1 [Humulus lupulus]XP_062113513.1 putative disease resistance protein At3g14460 isoform X1 [Humulus lupulus]XP_062113514.1 putative disease resistance protein At3g14460 isof